MPATYGWGSVCLWAAVEACPPYRLIGLYPSRYTAAQRAIEFGTPAVVQPVPDARSAAALADQVRRAREGR